MLIETLIIDRPIATPFEEDDPEETIDSIFFWMFG